jgi:hypothetical protein
LTSSRRRMTERSKREQHLIKVQTILTEMQLYDVIINIVCEFLELECEACHKKGSYGEMLREKTCPFHPRPSEYDDDYMPHVFTCCTHDQTDGKHYNKDFTKQSGPYRWKKKWGPIHNGCQRREHTFELCLICQIVHKLKYATQKGGCLVQSYRSTKDGLGVTFSKRFR